MLCSSGGGIHILLSGEAGGHQTCKLCAMFGDDRYYLLRNNTLLKGHLNKLSPPKIETYLEAFHLSIVLFILSAVTYMSGGGHTHSHCYRDSVQLETCAHPGPSHAVLFVLSAII